ncbi:hypothetical protein HAX54_048851 [Datura stramonium]|uniref:Uncharacterized protein n=1 Tax=Datura stramonium TaxID=4076 RepID=A0ABS8SU79_DATST|nr:hypothetical protein [Datura stramonium]
MDKSVRSVRNQNVHLTPKMAAGINDEIVRPREEDWAVLLFCDFSGLFVGGRPENGEKWREKRLFCGVERAAGRRHRGDCWFRGGEKRREIRWVHWLAGSYGGRAALRWLLSGLTGEERRKGALVWEFSCGGRWCEGERRGRRRERCSGVFLVGGRTGSRRSLPERMRERRGGEGAAVVRVRGRMRKMS